MTVSITLSFATIEEAAAFLKGKATTPAPAAVAAPAPTPPTAEVAAAAAPEKKAIDFDADVVEALRAYSKRVDPAVFKEFMASLKVAKVNDLKGKPEMWETIVAHCNG